MAATIGGGAPSAQQKQDLAQAFDLARVATDESGNVTGLVGPDGGVAYPVEELVVVPYGTLVPVLSSSLCVPLAVGVDGLVYGSTGLGSKTLTRTSNAFESQENGPTLPSVHTIIFATRVAEGYVAITSAEELFGSPGSNSNYSVGSEIWFSRNWGAGWAKVKDIGRTQGIAISRPVFSKEAGGTVITVGEYSQTAGQTHTLWMTKNGGETWAAIQALVAVDPAKNNHYHGSGFDKATGRIYVSHGDFENSWFGYTPDFGATWVAVPAAGMLPGSGTIYHQPVLCDACRNGLVTTPDSSTGKSGIWMVDRIDGYATPTYTLPELPADQYAEAPVAADGDYVRYSLHPMRGSRLSAKMYVLATGDGGRTWHKVLETLQATTQWYQRGIVGPDANGKLYLHCRDNATNQLYIADKVAWKSIPVGGVKASTGASLENLLLSANLLNAATPLPIDTRGATITAGNLVLNSVGAKITIGGATGIAVIDTPATVSVFRQLFGSNKIYELSATGAYGQVEYTGTITYIKFTGSSGGMIATQASQKIAFWGATPVVRPTGTPAAATDLASALTLLNDLRTKLLAIGLVG